MKLWIFINILNKPAAGDAANMGGGGTGAIGPGTKGGKIGGAATGNNPKSMHFQSRLQSKSYLELHKQEDQHQDSKLAQNWKQEHSHNNVLHARIDYWQV